MVLQGAQKTVIKATLTAIAMFGFGFAMVPLYDVFCKVTGLNGKTSDTPYEYRAEAARVDTSRTVTIQFVSTNNANMSWAFSPSIRKVSVHPGEVAELSFNVRNPTGQRMIGQAIPSVTPFDGTDFLHKTECFCFTTQPLEAFEEKNMPLKIIIDPALPRHIKKLTLSYTLFDVTDMYAAASTP